MQTPVGVGLGTVVAAAACDGTKRGVGDGAG